MRKLLILSLTMILLVTGGIALLAQQDEPDPQFVGTVPAPEFPADLDWFNVEAPLTMDGLRGKIVLFDFWTYGCINCIHMIPILAELEEKYSEELVVIGVHSAKFANEGESENLRQIVQRYDLHHPVINDKDFIVWRTYGIRAWPSFSIVDPRGNVVVIESGEIPFAAFDNYLTQMIDYYDGLGQDDIDRTPLDIALENAGNPGTPLLYPGKVLVDTEDNRLFIADSNHHRVVIADLDTYEVQQVIGTGSRGYTDGTLEAAQFDQPQGMALDSFNQILYVADVNNHAIRAIDLGLSEVTTLAGTGTMGRGFALGVGDVNRAPRDIDLRSPWDVELDGDGNLHIAMAGTHQLWVMNLEDDTIQVSVGNGREAQLSDVPLLDSELAQPSGLYFDNGELYFADSESSTIRVADFNEDEVRLIAGTTANDLFDFGDIDGELGVNRLQHALGVDGDDDNLIYIADTYNSKIRVYDKDTQETTTLFGLSGNGDFRDGDADTAQFDEPGGLDYVDGKIYVADTNNHSIRVIDLENGEVSTVTFPNPDMLTIERNAVTIVGGNAAAGETVTLDEQTIAAGNGILELSINLPDGFKINDLIDSTVMLTDNETVQFDSNSHVLTETSLDIPITLTAGDDTVILNLTVYYCETDNLSVCIIDDVTITVPVTVTENADNSILSVERDIILPEIAEGGL
ncbi:MAG: thioredoxin-like domain-containing protein [Aggregatilineales bacterium]